MLLRCGCQADALTKPIVQTHPKRENTTVKQPSDRTESSCRVDICNTGGSWPSLYFMPPKNEVHYFGTLNVDLWPNSALCHRELRVYGGRCYRQLRQETREP